MKVLAIDTSSAVAAVAVIDDDKLLGEYIINHKKTHSQKLMPMLRELLGTLELATGDIDVLAVAKGPGSFTGLRIGIAAVKGLAFALQKPVAAVSSLEAMAYNLPICDMPIAPIMDARNNQVYNGIYSLSNGEISTIRKPRAIELEALINEVKAGDRPTVFLGDGISPYGEQLKSQLGELCILAPQSVNMQRAASIAVLGYKMANRGELITADELVPFYLRKPQAQRELEKNR